LYIAFHLIATLVFPVLAAGPDKWLMSGIAFYFFATSEFFYLLICVSFLIYLWPARKGVYRALFYVSSFMTLGMTVFAVSSIVFRQGTFISKEGDWLGYFLLALFVLGEAWFSVKALTYREKRVELENAAFQNQLIAQLSESKRVQENFRRDLEVQVEERSGKILEQQKMLEQEREAKIVAVMNRRILETEMQALRAQMNPHFIFNSLNSIENFMMKNDKRKASDYFAKFALLIRMILDNSQKDMVAFAKDMEALQLYVELEQLRFDQHFSFQTIIDPLLKSEEYSVPPLLIQPFVENAIIHGLSQSDKPQLLLTVSAELDNDYIIYTIEDNGIGRTKSREYNYHKTKHQSLGLGITQQRIAILNQQQPDRGQVTIIDLYDAMDESAGTKVEVKLRAG
jgi:sensor histidine kinase YesM